MRESTTEVSAKSSLLSRRWILFGLGTIVLAALLIYGWTWYRGYRDWHNSKAAPLFSDIEPGDGATVYASDAWIRWSSPAAARGRVLWRKAGSSRVQLVDAGNGQELLAHLAPLSAGSKYEYIVEETDGSQTLRSPVRTLDVQSGLAFDPVIDQTVEHDYDQSVKLTLRNQGSQPITVAAKALKQFEDLPSDITGYGSVDVPGQIAPNGTLDIRLAVTAADATHDMYEIPIEAAGAYVTARFHVRMPKVNLALSVSGEDPNTLAKTVAIQNNGDKITDLTVRAAEANQQDLELQPSVNHAQLNTGSTLVVTVRPILYLEFQSLKAEIEATAGGQTTKLPLEFTAPPGVHLIAFRSASTGVSGCSGGYCTNNPNTCSECAGPPGSGPITNGPLGGGFADPPSPEPGSCRPPKCNIPDACEKLKALLELIKHDVDDIPDPLPKDYFVPLFSTFAAEFDKLFKQLLDLDLACRLDPSVNPEVEETLEKILRDRRSFQTVNNPIADVPRSSDCKEVLGPQSAQEKMACADYHAIEDIKANLQGLFDANCSKEKKGSGGCPETKLLEMMKSQAVWAARLTKLLKKISRQNDSELSQALDDTEELFEKLSDHLEKLINAAETCEKIKKIWEQLRALRDAIDKINHAGCNSQQVAAGFDDLAKAVGDLAKDLPLTKLDPELAGIADILSRDQNFFKNNSCALNPECRWNKQFKGVEGYIPDCSEVGPPPQ